MCRASLDFDNGICNGAIGVVTEIRERDRHVAVQFRTQSAVTIVKDYQFEARCGNTEVIVSRTQLPLIPAYAVTVHKVANHHLIQGTVDCAQFRSTHVAYSALSRFGGLGNTTIRSILRIAALRTDPTCLAFYSSLTGNIQGLTCNYLITCLTHESPCRPHPRIS